MAKRRLLLDHTAPRERALVRAFQRMLKAPRTSVYRRAAPNHIEPEPSAEPTVTDWIAKIAPGVAPFAPPSFAPVLPAVNVAAEAQAEPSLVKVAQERLHAKTAHTMKRSGKLLGLWMLLVMMFLAVWSFLSSARPERAHRLQRRRLSRRADHRLGGAGGGPAPVPARAQGVGAARGLEAALSAATLGDASGAAEVAKLTRSPQQLVAAQAHLCLARLAQRRASLDEARVHCEQGIAAVTAAPGVRAVASQILLPDLVGEHAFVLAARASSTRRPPS